MEEPRYNRAEAVSAAGRGVGPGGFVLAAAISLLSAGCALIPGGGREAGEMGIQITVSDERGRPVQDAVVFALPSGRMSPGGGCTRIVIQDNAFIPFVTPMEVGTSLTFLNRDQAQHHLYSFSPGKKFSVVLDSGAESGPIVMDRGGEVVLGCALNDRMVGYVYPVETRAFATTGRRGIAYIAGLPRRGCSVDAWHPSLGRSSAPVPTRVIPPRRGDARVHLVLPLRGESELRIAPPAPRRGRRAG